MSSEPIFGNLLVAVAEAAEVTGAPDLDSASVAQMAQAWGLVRRAAGFTRQGLVKRIADQSTLSVADLDAVDARTTTLVPPAVAHRRNVLPLRCTALDVFVATANPLSQVAKRELASMTGRSVVFEIAAPDEIAERIEALYGPISDEDRERSPSEAPALSQPKGPHILVVDDEVGQRTLFRSVLEEAGFRVDLATDGPAAIEILSDDPSYDLVTLDYRMDKMNGLRVLQHIRSNERMRNMPVIMVTGADDRQIEMSLFEAGADDYIGKPIDAPLFVLRVTAVLRRAWHR